MAETGVIPDLAAIRANDNGGVMFLTVDQTAELLHCKADTVRRLAAAGSIPGRRVGRRWLFDPDQLRAYVRGEWHSTDEANAWDRLLWGVELRTRRNDDPLLLGALWDEGHRTGTCYPGEPSRVLTFTTRAAAIAWCRARHAAYRDKPTGDSLRAWRFRPVRVRETVRVVGHTR